MAYGITPMSHPTHPIEHDMVTLRPVEDRDLDALFEQARDPAAVWMAAFTARDPEDRAAFDAHWARIRGRDGVVLRTIVWTEPAPPSEDASTPAERVAGYCCFFVRDGEPEIGYWVDRALWGRGVATAALRLFLPLVPARPVNGRVVADNLASIRVLTKCGFVFDRAERAYADGRAAEVDEWVMRLD